MSSFKEDIERGEIGEYLFELFYKEEYEKKGWKIEDERQKPRSQEKDIDYLLYRENITPDFFFSERLYLSGNPKEREERFKKAIAIEVKTDWDIEWSGNLCLEILSHNMPGCFARTYSDYFYYVGLNQKDEIHCVYLFDVFLMRNYIHKFYLRKDKNNKCGFSDNSLDKDKSSFWLGNVEKIQEFCKKHKLPTMIWDVTKKTKEALKKYGTTS